MMRLSAEENKKPSFYKTLFGSSSATASSVTFATVHNADRLMMGVATRKQANLFAS